VATLDEKTIFQEGKAAIKLLPSPLLKSLPFLKRQNESFLLRAIAKGIFVFLNLSEDF
jgi:hypothetical protein